MMQQSVVVPDLGEFSNVEVIEIAVKAGDHIDIESPLITLETDKAAMEIPAPVAGRVDTLNIKLGDKVSAGDLIMMVESTESVESNDDSAPVEPPAQTNGQANQIEHFKVPDIGSDEPVEIIEVLVAAGDVVEEGQGLIVLESEKASMELPAPVAGSIKVLHVALGDKVNQGSLVADIETTAVASTDSTTLNQATDAPSAQQAPAPSEVKQAAPVSQSSRVTELSERAEASAKRADIYAGPATRRLAADLGVDLTRLTGSGRKGRILTEDVQQFVKTQLAEGGQSGAASGSGLNLIPMPKVDFAKWGEVSSKPLNRIKRLTADNLSRNWVRIPHVTQFGSADITGLEAFRQSHKNDFQAEGVRLTMLALIAKALIGPLKAYPQFNASLSHDETELVFKSYVNIGIAVDTPNGLVVPVIRNVETLGVKAIATAIAELSEKARNGQLTAKDMQGSSFTISSLGGIGGTAFTPIINAPDVAILGLSKAAQQPVWDGNAFQPRLMLPLSLSYDHRVIDGAEAARFMAMLEGHLADIRLSLF